MKTRTLKADERQDYEGCPNCDGTGRDTCPLCSGTNIPFPEEQKDDSFNTNCLSGLRCPECQSNGPFRIQASALFTVYDDGTDESEGVEWDENSFILCTNCRKEGKVQDFRLPYACDNCGHCYSEGEAERFPVKFPKIPHLLKRIAPGETVPFGECPDCGALVHRI